jgi:hypothetical protein
MEFRFPGNIKDVSVKFKTDKDEVDPVAVLRIVIEADENQLTRADIPIGEQAAPYAASQIVALAKKTVHVQLATPQIELGLTPQEPVAAEVTA